MIADQPLGSSNIVNGDWSDGHGTLLTFIDQVSDPEVDATLRRLAL